jgi:hypothetical protein
MLSYDFWFNALWITHPILESVIAVAMWRGKAHRKFPYFFAYLLSQIGVFASQFPLYHMTPTDIPVRLAMPLYWVGVAVSLGLGFKVLHEVFVEIFRPFPTLKDLGTVLFRWAGLVMLLVGVVVAASTSSGWSLEQASIALQRCLRLTQVGLVLFLIVFSSYLGVNWRQRSFGISLGFGFFAACELVLWVMFFSHSVSLSREAATLANMAIWNVGLCIWGRYFVLPEPATWRAASSSLVPNRWNHALGEIQHPLPAESLIPMFESMVERALARGPADDGAQPELEKEKEKALAAPAASLR